MITSEYPFIYVTIAEDEAAKEMGFKPGISVLVLRMRDLPPSIPTIGKDYSEGQVEEPLTQVLLANDLDLLVWVDLNGVRFDRSEAIHHTIQTVQVGNDPGAN